MANRYWVGGTGSWSPSATTHWSTSSGGSAGASAPTQTDAAIFDANSGGGTVTLNGAQCMSFTCTGSTCTFTNIGSFNVYGDVTLASGGTYTAMYIAINGDCTFTSAGKTISNLNMNGVTPYTLTCADALSCANLGMSGDGTTVLLKDGVTSSITSITTPGSGMAYLRSTSAGSQATLSDSSGTNTLTYVTVKDIAFTGAANWSFGTGSVDDGNNTGISSAASATVPVLFAQSLA